MLSTSVEGSGLFRAFGVFCPLVPVRVLPCRQTIVPAMLTYGLLSCAHPHGLNPRSIDGFYFRFLRLKTAEQKTSGGSLRATHPVPRFMMSVSQLPITIC